MEESKDFDTALVKLEEEEQLEEEKPPVLAPPPTIPSYRGLPTKRARVGAGVWDSEAFTSEYTHNFSCIDRFNEELSMRFLSGAGLTLSKIEDPHLKSFLNHLNPMRPPPEACHLITKASAEIRPVVDYARNGPISVTIEAIRKGDEVFLSISVHLYGTDGERRNHVHFEKIILADYEGRVVADRLRRVIDPKRAYNFSIANIVSPNIRMVQLLAEHTKFKNKFICFFSYLSNIAREVILIDEFSTALRALRRFVEAVRRHPDVQFKLKRMQPETPIDVPNLDVGNEWLSTLNFLIPCGLLNEKFQNLNEGWCLPAYLTEDQENALANLVDFLTVLCHVATEICSADSCVSQVLYSMSVINNAIENCGIRAVRSQMRNVFSKYFQSISTGRIGDFYSIAAFLDPRYGYSTMILSEIDWKNMERKVMREATIINTDPSPSYVQQAVTEVGRYKEAMTDRPTFDESFTPAHWWNSLASEYPLLYKKWKEFSCPPAVSIDGKRLFGKGGKLAHLFLTLDEVLHHKATLLAQNSQDFVGRGHGSVLIFDQIKNLTATFRRLEDEPDLAINEEEVEEVEQKVAPLEEMYFKEEPVEEYVEAETAAPEAEQLLEVKQEEP